MHVNPAFAKVLRIIGFDIRYVRGQGAYLDRLMRRVNVVPGAGNLGIVDASGISTQPEGHLNKFGQPYDQDSKPPY